MKFIAVYNWPFLLGSDLSLLRSEDDHKGYREHHDGNQDSPKDSSSIIDTLDVSVFPDDV